MRVRHKTATLWDKKIISRALELEAADLAARTPSRIWHQMKKTTDTGEEMTQAARMQQQRMYIDLECLWECICICG
jgi:hypothetical protein